MKALLETQVPIRLCVAALITDDQARVLLVRNRRRDGWELPGGKVLAGETWERALEREVHEETGLGLTGIAVREVIHAGVQDGLTCDTLIIVACAHSTGTPIPGSDAIDAQWCARVALPCLAALPSAELVRRWAAQGDLSTTARARLRAVCDAAIPQADTGHGQACGCDECAACWARGAVVNEARAALAVAMPEVLDALERAEGETARHEQALIAAWEALPQDVRDEVSPGGGPAVEQGIRLLLDGRVGPFGPDTTMPPGSRDVEVTCLRRGDTSDIVSLSTFGPGGILGEHKRDAATRFVCVRGVVDWPGQADGHGAEGGRIPAGMPHTLRAGPEGALVVMWREP